MKSLLRCLICLSLWWAMPALADRVCDETFGVVCIETVTSGDQITFFGENRHTMLPVTLAVNLELQNLQVQSGSNGPFVLNGKNRVALFTLATRTPGAWRYSYDFTWSRGDVTARHDDGYRYRLPFEAGQAIQIGQSCNGRFSHLGPQRNAVDFAMAVGTPILAAREGQVVAVKEDSNRGGAARSFENDGNYVIVQHPDRTLAQYFHLQKNGAAVSLGQSVRRGQLLGYSGNTGRSTGPHLHFDVVKGSVGIESETLPIAFASASGVVRCPRQGALVEASD